MGRRASPNVVVRNDSPKTLYSAKPASLVVFDGDPVLVPIGKRGLSYAVWTNWMVFNGGSTWHLLAGRVWMEAPRAVGPYRPAAKLPAAFGALPRNANVANARSDIPAHPPGAGTLFVSIKPAEIIVTDCPANLAVTYSSASRFAPIQGATIRYAVNTPDQVAEVPVPDPAVGPYIHDLSKVGLNEETTHGS